MAGSGKTTLMQRLNAHLHSAGSPPYVVNLDPAVSHMPYTANIDIRDTVDYKEVMQQCGPPAGRAAPLQARRRLTPVSSA
jgi:GTPase SAR1 family protein